MAVSMDSEYLGDGQVRLKHGPSGAEILTDLPADNGGKGRVFSPTDLFGAALASCVLTIMAKVAERDGIDLRGASISMEKHMSDSPRRVGRMVGRVRFPGGVPARKKAKLMACIRACPVHRSLHPEVEVDFQEA